MARMRFALLFFLAACFTHETVDDAPGPDGGGDGAFCGGIAGLQCDDAHYCDFRANGCGGDDSGGTCMPRPPECAIGPDVCGCDGAIYQGECAAASAGVDLDDRGTCAPSGNTFACGHLFCQPMNEYCQVSLDDTGGANFYQCIPNPGACPDVGANCTCLAGESCGTSCAQTGTGFTLTCPGG